MHHSARTRRRCRVLACPTQRAQRTQSIRRWRLYVPSGWQAQATARAPLCSLRPLREIKKSAREYQLNLYNQLTKEKTAVKKI